MAVYTNIPPEELEAFLAEYDLGPLKRVDGIAEGVENTNYLIETEAGRAILTLYEKRVREEELPWFLGLMQHLARRGLKCPTPVIARDGVALRRLMDRPAAITTFLTGRPIETITASACFSLGQSLARMHLLGDGFRAHRPNSLGPDAWRPLLNSCHGAADTVQPGLTAELENAISEVLAAWPASGSLPVGQIHADLFPDNAFFERGNVSGLIDFYFACTDLLAYDLAICLNAWCFPDERTPDAALMAGLMGGYQSIRPLAAEEKAALPALVQGASIRFLLTRLYDWVNTPVDAIVTRKDPLAYHHRLVAWRADARGLLHV
ncbi:homoserine kinase [Asaia krungthepensis]|uniref:Homoserine kinase n=1 Tax=Asaia krungthepensis NRIC 0535 TaxID=1307925 RepID=A0ABQ0Q200_9PROT|nr:homoserine kinase [Asaia krungthepensis]GBQ87488.1 homoserine kinase [Asaia krungthepensis NRIC 0535]